MHEQGNSQFICKFHMNSCLNMSKNSKQCFCHFNDLYITFITWWWNCTKAGGFGRCAKVGQNFHHVRRASVQQLFNKQIQNYYLDQVTKVHVIGLMLDDRWMYQKIEGCLLVYFLCRDGRSFRVPALPSLKRYCKMSRAMPSMMGTSLAYHIIGYKPH